jgi:hypothetical protein
MEGAFLKELLDPGHGPDYGVDGAAKGVVTQRMFSAHGQTVVLDNSS